MRKSRAETDGNQQLIRMEAEGTNHCWIDLLAVAFGAVGVDAKWQMKFGDLIDLRAHPQRRCCHDPWCRRRSHGKLDSVCRGVAVHNSSVCELAILLHLG